MTGTGPVADAGTGGTHPAELAGRAGSWWGEDLLGRGADEALWACATNSVTAGRLRAEVAWLSRVYQRQGIGVRSTVSMHGTPSFTKLWSVFALWSLGAQVLMLEQLLPAADMAAALAEARPQFHLSFGRSDRSYRPFASECEVMLTVRAGGEPATTDHCLVHLSSGSTGRGKIVGRTAESLLAEVDRLGALADMPRRGERVLLLDSWTHSFGLIGGVLHGLSRGATLVFPTSRAQDRILAAARDAHVLIGTPMHFERLSDMPGKPSMPLLRAAISGGEVLQPSVFDRFARRYGVRIGQVYGTTEVGAIAADLGGRFAPPHVGRPLAGMRVRIEDGVLQVHQGQSPYLTDTRPWLGGWMSTQDRVALDPVTGALRLCGRVGADRAPEYSEVDLLEVERVLRSNRHVDDAVVFGHDGIEAHVSGSSSLAHVDLVEWCRRLLDGDKVPSRCHLVRALPRTANGKPLRNRELLGKSA